jgi:hypothetical protein
MQRNRIEWRRIRRERPWYRGLPPHPRAPDVVQAKHWPVPATPSAE